MRLALIAACLICGPAMGGYWFTHKYGELRAFDGDWLAACTDNGAGACRTVQTGLVAKKGEFFDVRLSVHRIDNSPNWAVDVMDRGLPGSGLDSLTFIFDGKAVEIPAGKWKQGTVEDYNAVDTVAISDPELAQDLVNRMKKGSRLVIRYTPVGEGDGEAAFSLRGATASMNAIDARVLARQE